MNLDLIPQEACFLDGTRVCQQLGVNEWRHNSDCLQEIPLGTYSGLNLILTSSITVTPFCRTLV